VPSTYYQDVVQIPYGYVFTNQTVVVDFLLSYGALLQSQGLVFDDRENGYALNWDQMAQEFLYWANQGWATGAVINLNPTATSLTAVKAEAVVDSIMAQTPENLILDQNRTDYTCT
jgi:sugar lactone lactonase YvrE